MVADGRKDRHPDDGEPVGLKEAGVPVVVLSAALLVHASLLALVDVVAKRQDESDVVVSDEPFEHIGDAPLAAAGLRVRPHPDPVVAHGHEADRRRRVVGVRPGAEPQVVVPPGRGEVIAAALSGDPVPQLPGGPFPAVDLDAVAVVSLGLETLDPHPYVFVGGGFGRNVSVRREDLHGRGAERLSRRSDTGAAAHPAQELLVVDDLPAAALRPLEIERAPRDEGSVVREIDEVDERLAVNLDAAHWPSMPEGRAQAIRSMPRWPVHRGEPLRPGLVRALGADHVIDTPARISPTASTATTWSRHRRQPTAVPPTACPHPQGKARHRRGRDRWSLAGGYRPTAAGPAAVPLRQPEARHLRLIGERRRPGRVA